MIVQREVEGIGYHDARYSDCLLVEKWFERPGDLKGQVLNISKLLPPELRGNDSFGGYDAGNVPESLSREFWFRITLEIDLSRVDKG
jgi:hypothetical protein